MCPSIPFNTRNNACQLQNPSAPENLLHGVVLVDTTKRKKERKKANNLATTMMMNKGKDPKRISSNSKWTSWIILTIFCVCSTICVLDPTGTGTVFLFVMANKQCIQPIRKKVWDPPCYQAEVPRTIRAAIWPSSSSSPSTSTNTASVDETCKFDSSAADNKDKNINNDGNDSDIDNDNDNDGAGESCGKENENDNDDNGGESKMTTMMDVCSFVAQTILADYPIFDMVIINSGTCARGVDIPAGIPFDQHDVNRLLPYRNELVVVQLLGKHIIRALEDAMYYASYGEYNTDDDDDDDDQDEEENEIDNDRYSSPGRENVVIHGKPGAYPKTAGIYYKIKDEETNAQQQSQTLINKIPATKIIGTATSTPPSSNGNKPLRVIRHHKDEDPIAVAADAFATLKNNDDKSKSRERVSKNDNHKERKTKQQTNDDGEKNFHATITRTTRTTTRGRPRLDQVEVLKPNCIKAPLDPNRSYTVVTTEYLAQGHDGYNVFATLGQPFHRRSSTSKHTSKKKRQQDGYLWNDSFLPLGTSEADSFWFYTQSTCRLEIDFESKLDRLLKSARPENIEIIYKMGHFGTDYSHNRTRTIMTTTHFI